MIQELSKIFYSSTVLHERRTMNLSEGCTSWTSLSNRPRSCFSSQALLLAAMLVEIFSPMDFFWSVTTHGSRDPQSFFLKMCCIDNNSEEEFQHFLSLLRLYKEVTDSWRSCFLVLKIKLLSRIIVLKKIVPCPAIYQL